MSSEVNIRSSLQIKNGNLSYQSQPTSFIGNQTTPKGPCPGAITVATGAGTDIDLSQLTVPAYGRLMNLDPTNFVTIGTRDTTTNRFHPLTEILPGESYPLRLSRTLTTEYGTAGTVTDTHDVLHAKADTASVVLLAEFFES